ncbi:MAG: Modification methylase PaeR7I [Syntrophus sp. PtaB.Bin001]|nr:MAG: Modification methylase PaeR7I [Syntrophus sp. PtaB.Bin001]
MGGYNWQEVDILIRNETFGEIFDTFDLYNFTVREDEPLEKEVAVDPEMLGKVFENLLEIRDRKSKGAYYTPRQIVHYMCQESLIHYLDSTLNNGPAGYERLGLPQIELFGPGDLAKPDGRMELMVKCNPESIPREDIRLLIRQGQFGIENDLKVDEKGRETPTYSWKLPKSIRDHAERIDQALADIKICDPAIGSGAFPVGMLHEIVRARETLSTYLPDNPERTPYNFKRHAIQESIYGVDIDCGAVDIAKLRLWLSLVVDEDDFRVIKPLPNLDYKIVCGNSLTKVERDLLNDHLFAELEILKQRYFDEINPRQKKEEKAGIESLIRQLTHNDEHFDYTVYFSEIFHPQPGHNGRRSPGFDLVIANPPYVRQETIKSLKPQLKQTFGKFYCGTADLYTYFYKRGLELLRDGGHLCFIAPNKFMRAGYGKNTRMLLTGQATPKVIIDFGDLPIFDATTYPSIILVEKSKPEDDAKTLAATFTESAQLENPEKTLAAISFDMPVSALKPEGWTLERPEVLALMEKLRKAGKPLGEYVEGKFYYGIKTGLNEAFVIDEATRQRLIAEDPRSAELIKPWLRGRDIRKWKAQWAGLYVIFTRRGTDIEQYPAIKRHLEQFRKDLEPKKSDKDKRGRKPGSYKWFEIQDNIAYFEEFEKPKMVWRHFTTVPEFIYDEASHFSNDKSYILPTDDHALLGILNSKVTNFFIRQISPPVRGGFMEMRIIFMEQLPIPFATDAQKAPIIERVQQILADPDNPDVLRLEAEIDRLVYELYGLTTKEIEIVEGKKKRNDNG